MEKSKAHIINFVDHLIHQTIVMRIIAVKS